MSEFKKYLQQIAKKITSYRKNLGWTQEDLAHYSLISCRQIQRIEAAKGASSLKTYFKLASALKISVTCLLNPKSNNCPTLDIPSTKILFKIVQKVNEAGTWDWNLKTNEVKWSEEVYRLFNVTPQNFRPTFENFLKKVDPRDVEYIKSELNSALTNEGHKYQVRYRIMNESDNSRGRWVLATATLFHDENMNPARMIGIVQEVLSI